jgi:hypothetical protein
MTTTAYPTSQLTNAKVGTIIVEPLTPKHKKHAFEALKKRGVKVLPAELDSPSLDLVTEFALACVQSWKTGEGADLTPVAKRDILESYDSVRDGILAAGNKLNEVFNAGSELEEKNS